MGDKEMVNDILSMVKSSLTTYTSSISECSNQQLRQTLQQIRNSDEQFQYQLYQMAESKGFYKPATQADSQDIQQVRSAVSS
ncbi:MAG TPA: spore coat protein [Syntrophomonas sp.]|nr:spore coat protein [Syntrophomonas sp.]